VSGVGEAMSEWESPTSELKGKDGHGTLPLSPLNKHTLDPALSDL